MHNVVSIVQMCYVLGYCMLFRCPSNMWHLCNVQPSGSDCGNGPRIVMFSFGQLTR